MHKTVLKLDLTKSNIETIIVDIYDENIREIIGVGSYEKKGFLGNELVNIDQAIYSINQAHYIAKKDFISVLKIYLFFEWGKIASFALIAFRYEKTTFSFIGRYSNIKRFKNRWKSFNFFDGENVFLE